jgi:ketosteroid isomerase-like protein
MRYSIVAIIALPLAMPIASKVSAQSAKAGAGASAQNVEQVRAAEREWLDAYYRADMKALDTVESDDFTLIVPPGMLTKPQQLSAMQAHLSQAGGASASAPLLYALSDQTIRIYGDAALVTDTCAVPENASQLTSAGRYWQTEVWRKEGGNWKIVHMHVSPHMHGM